MPPVTRSATLSPTRPIVPVVSDMLPQRIALFALTSASSAATRGMTGQLGIINPSVGSANSYELSPDIITNSTSPTLKGVVTTTGGKITVPKGQFGFDGVRFRSFPAFVGVAQLTFNYMTTVQNAVFDNGRGAAGEPLRRIVERQVHAEAQQRLAGDGVIVEARGVDVATIRRGYEDPPGSGEVRIQMRGVVYQGDSMDVWVDGVNGRPSRFEVFTALYGEPVGVSVRFGGDPRGPALPVFAQVRTETKEKETEIRVEISDHARRENP